MTDDPEAERPVPTQPGNRRERIETILADFNRYGRRSIDAILEELDAAWREGYRMGAASARRGPAVPGEPPRRSMQYLQGYRASTKDAIDWLHHRAAEMNEWRPRQTLHSAAFGLGVSRSIDKLDAAGGRDDGGG